MGRRMQLIAGNWKMNMLRDSAATLARDIAAGAGGLACELAICPPFTALDAVRAALSGADIMLGAQDCHAEASGAYTGDIAAPMLADAGCATVILGHSERRQFHGESSAAVRAKVLAAAAAGLMPIVCVGETEAERESGDAERLVCSQVADSLPRSFTGVLAYEPIWAIGTGKTPTLQDVEVMHREIRAALVSHLGEAAGRGVRILYGGSVKPENAAELLAAAEVGGALVGGASLKAADFLAIAAGAARG